MLTERSLFGIGYYKLTKALKLHPKGNFITANEDDIAIDSIESLILGLACAGIDVSTPQFRDGIISALDAIANNL